MSKEPPSPSSAHNLGPDGLAALPTSAPLMGSAAFLSALKIPVDAFAVIVSDGADGTPVVDKDHSGPLPDAGRTTEEHAAAVSREVAWLATAAGLTGIAPLVTEPSTPDTADPPTVTTEFVGGATLRSSRLRPAEAARVLASVADTIAALAERELAHGSIAPEHIVISGNGGGVLCSPNTSTDSADHLDDLAGLGACVTFCLDQWAGTPAMPHNLAAWLLLARRLEDRDPAMGPWRAATTLRELGSLGATEQGTLPQRLRALPSRLRLPSLHWPTPSVSVRSRRLGVVCGALICVVGGVVLLLPPSTEAKVTGPELFVRGQHIRVGESGQVAIAPEPPATCPGAEVYLLDPATAWIWTFDAISPGLGVPSVQVPGATTLSVRVGPEGCPKVIASGPGGSVELDRAP